MSEPTINEVSTKHPHEPDVLPVLDGEGRCLVCKALIEAETLGWNRGYSSAIDAPLWLLRGDLNLLESMIAEHIWSFGQHLPGVQPDGIAGTPVAAANMAMDVIRKNVKRLSATS